MFVCTFNSQEIDLYCKVDRQESTNGKKGADNNTVAKLSLRLHLKAESTGLSQWLENVIDAFGRFHGHRRLFHDNLRAASVFCDGTRNRLDVLEIGGAALHMIGLLYCCYHCQYLNLTLAVYAQPSKASTICHKQPNFFAFPVFE